MQWLVNTTKVPLEERKAALRGRLDHYLAEGYELLSKTDTGAELIGPPLSEKSNMSGYLDIWVLLFSPILFILQWLLLPFVLAAKALMSGLAGLLTKFGMRFDKPRMLILLSVDERGRVHERKDWILDESE